MNETNPSTPADGVLPASGTQVELSHKEFCAGLPAGRLHLIVNPERAQKYIRHRLFVVGLALPVIAIGTALAWSGYLWAGFPMVALGVLFPRVVKVHAAKILLHLVLREEKTYREALDFEIMEVRLR
ncbi:MAG: hypothetical protein RL075_1251 [Pseudomonadota bacterium]